MTWCDYINWPYWFWQSARYLNPITCLSWVFCLAFKLPLLLASNVVILALALSLKQQNNVAIQLDSVLAIPSAHLTADFFPWEPHPCRSCLQCNAIWTLSRGWSLTYYLNCGNSILRLMRNTWESKQWTFYWNQADSVDKTQECLVIFPQSLTLFT